MFPLSDSCSALVIVFRGVSLLTNQKHYRFLVKPRFELAELYRFFFFFDYKSLHYAGVPLNEERKITERLIKAFV